MGKFLSCATTEFSERYDKLKKLALVGVSQCVMQTKPGRWAEHIARIGKNKKIIKFSSKNLKGRDHMGRFWLQTGG
jgi:pullulanase/glycogen debranching enzyme